MIDFKWWICL